MPFALAFSVLLCCPHVCRLFQSGLEVGWGAGGLLNTASRPRVGSAHLTPPGLRLECLPPLSSAAGDSPGGLLGRSPQGRPGPSPSSPERGLPAPCPGSAAPGGAVRLLLLSQFSVGGWSPWPSGQSQRQKRGSILPTDGQAAGPAGAGAGLGRGSPRHPLGRAAVPLRIIGCPGRLSPVRRVHRRRCCPCPVGPTRPVPSGRGWGDIPGSAQVSCAGLGRRPQDASVPHLCVQGTHQCPPRGQGERRGRAQCPGRPSSPSLHPQVPVLCQLLGSVPGTQPETEPA